MTISKKLLPWAVVVFGLSIYILFKMLQRGETTTYEVFSPFQLYNQQYTYIGAVRQLTSRAYAVQSENDSLHAGILRYTYITSFDRELRHYTEFQVISPGDTSMIQAQYNELGHLQKVIFESGSSSFATYDKAGFLQKVVDRNAEGRPVQRELFKTENGRYKEKTILDGKGVVLRRFEYSWLPNGSLQAVRIFVPAADQQWLEENITFTELEAGHSQYQRKRYSETGALQELEDTWLYHGFVEKSTVVTNGDTSRYVNNLDLDSRGNPVKVVYRLDGEVYQVDLFEYIYF